MSAQELFGEPISVYTRAQAIEDGELVDVTEWASSKTGFMGGFTVPVAVTRSVWADIEMSSLEGSDTRDLRQSGKDRSLCPVSPLCSAESVVCRSSFRLGARFVAAVESSGIELALTRVVGLVQVGSWQGHVPDG